MCRTLNLNPDVTPVVQSLVKPQNHLCVLFSVIFNCLYGSLMTSPSGTTLPVCHDKLLMFKPIYNVFMLPVCPVDKTAPYLHAPFHFCIFSCLIFWAGLILKSFFPFPSCLPSVHRSERGAASGHRPPGFTDRSGVFPPSRQADNWGQTREELCSFRSGETTPALSAPPPPRPATVIPS